VGAVWALSAACESSPTAPAPACAYTLSATSLSFGSPGGSGSVAVSSASQCSWTARAESSWVSITSGASGVGPGTVSFSVAPNSDPSPRSGGLSVAGQAVSIAQEAAAAPAPCEYIASPDSATFPKDGGAGTIAVTAPAQCAWSAESQVPWLTVTSGGQGTGNGTVSYTVSRNADPGDRHGGLMVADHMVEITQSGDTGSCQYSVAPVEVTPCMRAPYELTTTITTQPSCTWTASPNASWITITGGNTGSGSGTVSFTVTDNWEAPREGIVMVRWPTQTAGQNVRVRQAGCYYAVTPSAISMASAGGPSMFDVWQTSDPNVCGGPTQNACLWTAVADVAWITITTSMPHSGDDRVAFTVAQNTATSARQGSIRVRDKTVVITQAGR